MYIDQLLGESMQLLWHSLINMSFGYLMLIATMRIAQELIRGGSSMSASPSVVTKAAEPQYRKR
jgi:hypothetical protein